MYSCLTTFFLFSVDLKTDSKVEVLCNCMYSKLVSVKIIHFANQFSYLNVIFMLQIPEAAQVMCLKEEQFKTCNNRFIKMFFSYYR